MLLFSFHFLISFKLIRKSKNTSGSGRSKRSSLVGLCHVHLRPVTITLALVGVLPGNFVRIGGLFLQNTGRFMEMILDLATVVMVDVLDHFGEDHQSQNEPEPARKVPNEPENGEKHREQHQEF